MLQPALPPNLIHDGHDDRALLPIQPLALQPAIPPAPRRLVRLVVHAVSVPGKRERALLDLARIAGGVLVRDEAVYGWSEGGPVDVDLALRAHDSDSGLCALFAIGVGRDADARHSHAVAFPLGVRRAVREFEEHYRVLVSPGLRVVRHLRDDLGHRSLVFG